MEEKKDNRRVRYTKMVLRESLLELLKTKPLNRITVTDLCTLADLNRGTFYSYYRDVFDLLEQIENDFFEEIRTYIQSSRSVRQYPDFVYDIIDAVDKNREFCNILLGQNGDDQFLVRVLEAARETAIAEWSNMCTANISEQSMDYMYTFIANGAVGIVRDWLADSRGLSRTELTQFIIDFSSMGIDRYLKREFE